MTHSKQALRLWLKLLSATGQIEKTIKGRLRDEFETTLPRFDVLAMLDFAGEDGLNMGELSRRLMVSNGNVTGIVNRLEQDGLINRTADKNDRRTQWITLTEAGRTAFKTQANHHESWVEMLMSDLDDNEMDQMLRLLDKLRHSAEAHTGLEQS